MKGDTTYILINDYCWNNISGFDILNVFEKEQDAIDEIHTDALDFIHDCDKGEHEDFTDYIVETYEEACSITITSKTDDNLFERYYILKKVIV